VKEDGDLDVSAANTDSYVQKVRENMLDYYSSEFGVWVCAFWQDAYTLADVYKSMTKDNMQTELLETGQEVGIGLYYDTQKRKCYWIVLVVLPEDSNETTTTTSGTTTATVAESGSYSVEDNKAEIVESSAMKF